LRVYRKILGRFYPLGKKANSENILGKNEENIEESAISNMLRVRTASRSWKFG